MKNYSSHSLNLECCTEKGKLSLPIKVAISSSGIVIYIEGYEDNLSVVVEYYEGCLQALIWGEESITEDCKKIVLSSNVPETLRILDEHYKE